VAGEFPGCQSPGEIISPRAIDGDTILVAWPDGRTENVRILEVPHGDLRAGIPGGTRKALRLNLCPGSCGGPRRLPGVWVDRQFLARHEGKLGSHPNFKGLCLSPNPAPFLDLLCCAPGQLVARASPSGCLVAGDTQGFHPSLRK